MRKILSVGLIIGFIVGLVFPFLVFQFGVSDFSPTTIPLLLFSSLFFGMLFAFFSGVLRIGLSFIQDLFKNAHEKR